MNLKEYREKTLSENTNITFSCAEFLQSMKEMEEDEERRHLYIDDEIGITNDETGIHGINLNSLIHIIERYNYDDKDIPVEERLPIKIFIDSPGGDQVSANIFSNIIHMSKTPVYTINIGQAFSAAGLILIAGQKRFAMPGSYALIHSGSASVSGTKEQVESQHKFIKEIEKKSEEFVLSNTKIDKKQYAKNAPGDWYISDEKQVELGIVDEIVTDISVVY